MIFMQKQINEFISSKYFSFNKKTFLFDSLRTKNLRLVDYEEINKTTNYIRRY